MIVLDASALIELVRASPVGKRVLERLAATEGHPHVPHLADLEVAEGLRRQVLLGEASWADAQAHMASFRHLELQRHEHGPLLDRVWELRRNLSAYDAAYVALAEALGATLLTCDRRLARAPGTSAQVEVVSASPM